MELSKTENDLLLRKFGNGFVNWIEEYGKTANFFVACEVEDQRWAAILCMGYAYLAGVRQHPATGGDE